MNYEIDQNINTDTTINTSTSTNTKKIVVKKSLPAKYNQLLVFGYWFLNHQKSSGKITPEVYDEYLHTFHVFDGIEDQMEYLNNFLNDFKLIQKNLKNDIRKKNKKPKTKKKKEIDPNVPPKKRGRKKKEVVDNRTPEQKLIDEIVANAQLGISSEEKTISPVPEVKSEIKWIVVGECPVNPGNDCENKQDAHNEVDEHLDSEEEIEVRKFIYNDILYLIDDNDNIYDHHTHNIMGRWNNVTQQIGKIESDDSDQELSQESYEKKDDNNDNSNCDVNEETCAQDKLTQYDQNGFKNNKYGRELYVSKIFDIRKNGLYCTKAIQKSGCVLKIEGGCLIPREEFQQLQSKPCEKFEPKTREFETYVKVETENYDDAMLNIYAWEEKACAMNHSCHPNAYIVAEDGLNRHGEKCKHFCVYALENIPENTEITIDYGWSAKNYNELKFCKCGSENCRGIIHNNGSFREKNGKMYKQFEHEEPVFLSKCEYMPIFDYDYLWCGEEEKIHHRWEFTDEPDLIQKEKSKSKRGRKKKFQYLQTVGHMYEDEPYGSEFNNRPTRNITMYFDIDGAIEMKQFRRDEIGNVFDLNDECKINSIRLS